MANVKRDEICEKFKTEPITPALIQRFEKLTGVKAHPFLRRGLYFAHRDLEQFLDAYEQGRPVYIYTGRGPSSDALHLGHMIPFFFCSYLQKALKCYLVVQITDDEKYLRDQSLEFPTIDGYALSNIKDILACDFDLEKTFIFLNSAYIGRVARFSCEFERLITLNQLRACFGFTDASNTGYVSFPPKQMQPAFFKFFPNIFTPEYCKQWKCERMGMVYDPSKDDIQIKDGMTKQQIEKLRAKKQVLGPQLQPYCLIPSGYEQDPYFRIARDVAPRLGLPKPSTIYNSFIPALRGCEAKMSASDPSNAVYMTDSTEQIAQKITQYAYSASRVTPDGRTVGDVENDVCVKYLEVFLEDDCELEGLKARYSAGEISALEVKAVLIGALQGVVKKHQERRAAISDDEVRLNVYGWGRSLK